MADLGLHGVIRDKPVRTTVQDNAASCPLDGVNRVFHAPAPNRLWLTSSTYVSTWSGFVYVAFVIDAYARRIVSCQVSRTAHASFVRAALEQALHERRPVHRGGLVHHSDRDLNKSASATPGAWRKQALSLSSAASEIPTTTRWPRRSTVSTRPRSSVAVAVAQLRGRRIRDADLGRLIQQSPAAGVHRQHPAGRSRGTLLRHAGRACPGGATQTKQPPGTRGGSDTSEHTVTKPPSDSRSCWSN
jgi:hypothetical protein